MTASQSVTVIKAQDHHVLTLNRPEKLNSLTGDVFESLMKAIAAAEADAACRAIILTGAGRGFCAGQDLFDLMKSPDEIPDPGPMVERYYNVLVRQMRASPLPFVCAVNGVAAGAGANIAFACDIVLAARSAKFVQPFVKLALVPDSGGTWFLPRIAGTARSRALALLGDTVSAEQAETWGMIWKCVDDEKLADEAKRIARLLASSSSSGIALIKRALNEGETNTLDRQLDVERDQQALAGKSDDYKEGVTAFLQKRPAKFGPRK